MKHKALLGPWVAVLAGGIPDNSIRIETLEGRPIARVFGPAFRTDAEARLIAAAPDLLEACKAVVVAHGRISDRADAIQLAMAAIAKAEGKE